MNETPIHALVIVAHPDDESFLFAGTTMKLESEGKNVAVICATQGEQGVDRLNRNLSPIEIAKIRTREMFSACNILHCECKKIFGFQDGNLDQTNFNQLVDELTNEINNLKPKIVLTFGEEGVTGHRDHIALGKATLAACQKASPKPSEVWCACIPTSLVESYNQHMAKQRVHDAHYAKTNLQGVDDEKIKTVEVKPYQKEKMAALKAHQSQHDPHLIWPKFMEYEYFEIIKIP